MPTLDDAELEAHARRMHQLAVCLVGGEAAPIHRRRVAFVPPGGTKRVDVGGERYDPWFTGTVVTISGAAVRGPVARSKESVVVVEGQAAETERRVDLRAQGAP